MSARYIPLAVSTTPSRCRRPPHGVDNLLTMSATRVRVGNLLTMSTTRVRVGNPLTVSTTRAHARARRMPQSGLGLQLGGIMPPRVPGGFPRKAESTTGCLGCPRARGMPYFLLQWEERNERGPLVSRDCLCPPRVRGTPARARAGRASALSRPDARGNARTRQGWPVLAGDEDAQAGERPHARQGWSPVRLPPGCPPPLGYAHKNPDLQNTHRAQGGDPALVRGPVFPNSLPCVRH